MASTLISHLKGFSRAALTAAFAAAILAHSAEALAVTTLRQVQVTNGTQVDLLFDGKVNPKQVRTEFFNDIIQLSLDETAVYPAKISTVNGASLVKVFAYQYAPKLVRCRLTVKGRAEDYKDRLQVSPSTNGKLLTVRLESGVAQNDRISTTAAQASRVVPGTGGDSSPAAKGALGSGSASGAAAAVGPQPSAPGAAKVQVGAGNIEEAALLQRVMSGAAPAPEAAPKQAATTSGTAGPAEAPEARHSRELREKEQHTPALGGKTHPLGGAHPLPSLTSVIFKLAIVLALFGFTAIVVRQFRGGSARSAARSLQAAAPELAKGGFGSRLTRALGGFGSMGAKEKLIEVLSTHYLGPKKSIAVVRVLGRVLVLAVANESISLITQLEGGSDPLAGLEDLGIQGGTFEDALGIARSGPMISPTPAPSRPMMQNQAAPAQRSPQYTQQPLHAQQPQVPMGAGATAAGPAVFADLLRPAHSAQATRQAMASQAVPAQATAPSSGASAGVRDQIRNRLEGLKQL